MVPMTSKEPHPQAEYLSANHDQLIGLLDLSNELLLRHPPIVTVMVEATRLPSISVWGQELESYDPETPVGVTAISRAQEARRRLSDFSTQVALRLLASDADALEEKAATGPAASSQQRRLAAAVNASGRTFASMAFEQPETQQLITIETVTMHGEAAPLARGLVLHIDDEQLSRNVHIGHLEQPPIPVEPALWVSQSMGPIRDSEVQQMAEFFLRDYHDNDGYDTVLVVFQQGLRARPVEGLLADLYSRYTDPEERARVEGFVAIMQRRAAAAREQLGLMLYNPELTRPSESELDDYTQLFRSLLG